MDILLRVIFLFDSVTKQLSSVLLASFVLSIGRAHKKPINGVSYTFIIS